jgi:hypothetical protein
VDVLDEVHRVTGFSSKIYVGAVDMRKARTKKPKGMAAWVFDDDTLAAMREMGYAKVQLSQVAVLADGARLFLVMTKRHDPDDEGDEGEGSEGDEGGGDDDE